MGSDYGPGLSGVRINRNLTFKFSAILGNVMEFQNVMVSDHYRLSFFIKIVKDKMIFNLLEPMWKSSKESFNKISCQQHSPEVVIVWAEVVVVLELLQPVLLHL